MKNKSIDARTCVVTGFQGPNAGAERKRFDEATILSSKMNVEEKDQTSLK